MTTAVTAANTGAASTVVAPPGSTAPLPAAATDGEVSLALAVKRSDTVVTRRYQRAPLRVFTPRSDESGLLQAVVANISGGLVGGDRLEVKVELGPGARALVLGQAAEKVYRALPGSHCSLDTRLEVGEGGWLEYMPQGTILFDGCRLRRQTTVCVQGDARALVGEMLVLGRVSSGEELADVAFNESWTVKVDGRLAWADRLRLPEGQAWLLSANAGFGGARALATLLYLAPDAAGQLDTARQVIADCAQGTRASVSCPGPLLVLRLLDEDPARLREALGRCWAALRQRLAGLVELTPTVWSA